ncbi:MocR-like pyridoxine biosynthesis transcription factor PdxR [Grimontia sp. NTOU-MAR1]|uniref:MocR-like pyridoxine biosynthesis transcription factor PdxR n=1 Tax=Grimontia sp. NTOU-MAR1 TaxID=3111011 RepID=UPI002DB6759A|nr:PLP-dependent aminotransferase family protein [Grimontia sp. NTOU-MAR1]WRW00447.1 PLP-dependent aminotransferase family protein [Grimontia sp. NTOU-MAR1]
MQPIDIGDLQLASEKSSKQSALYAAIQEKILNQRWPHHGRLPATRFMAQELGLSRNTVTAVYEQLKAEGYLESRRGAGYFVNVSTPEQFLQAENGRSSVTRSHSDDTAAAPENFDTQKRNRAFAPGVPDLVHFPYKKWARAMQLQFQRSFIAGQNDIQGSLTFRKALSEYLSVSRSVSAPAHRIIVTFGAQQALYIASNAILKAGDSVMMENPGYVQMRKVLKRSDMKIEELPVMPKTGADVDKIEQFEGHAVYLTPSNQYPMGTSLNTSQRMRCIEWASQQARWIIEDDYDSEFQFANRPYPSLQGLATQLHGEDARVIYIGTFSKAFLPSVRVGYLVVPEALVEPCLQIKDAIGGDTPIHIEEALATFISEGDYLRHIRKMRSLYQEKQRLFVELLTKACGDQVEILSQAAGLHVTFRWKEGPTATEVKTRFDALGYTIRTLDYYCDSHQDRVCPVETERTMVAGFGNSSLSDIQEGVALLAALING